MDHPDLVDAARKFAYNRLRRIAYARAAHVVSHLWLMQEAEDIAQDAILGLLRGTCPINRKHACIAVRWAVSRRLERERRLGRLGVQKDIAEADVPEPVVECSREPAEEKLAALYPRLRPAARRVLDAVVEYGSIRAAAEGMGKTEPYVRAVVARVRAVQLTSR